jgi:hypothetical protein
MFVPLVHVHTLVKKIKNKKFHLLYEVCSHDEREVRYIWYQSGFDPRHGIRYGFR